ncbi:MAG TPA: hypothetical protein PLZ84_04075, partial [Clostridia bacterium]|nr:hypothetical protein [Clostridia bacterium]
MIKFWRMVTAQLFKHFSKIGSWIMVGLIVVYCIGAGGILWYYYYQKDSYSEKNKRSQLEYLIHDVKGVEAPEGYQSTLDEVAAVLQGFLDDDINDWRYKGLRDVLFSTIYLVPSKPGPGIEPSIPNQEPNEEYIKQQYEALKNLLGIIKANDWEAYMQLQIKQAEQHAMSGDIYAQFRLEAFKFQLKHNAKEPWADDVADTISNNASALVSAKSQLEYLDDENYGQGMGLTPDEIERKKESERKRLNNEIKFYEEQNKILYYRIVVISSIVCHTP